LRSKNASADFQNFCRLAPKKGAESASFLQLRGNTDHYRHKKKLKEKHLRAAELKQSAITDKPETKTESHLGKHKSK